MTDLDEIARMWMVKTLRERHDRDVKEGMMYPTIAPELDDIEKVTFEIEDEGGNISGDCHVYIQVIATLTKAAQRRFHVDRRWIYLTINRDDLRDLLRELTDLAAS